MQNVAATTLLLFSLDRKMPSMRRQLTAPCKAIFATVEFSEERQSSLSEQRGRASSRVRKQGSKNQLYQQFLACSLFSGLYLLVSPDIQPFRFHSGRSKLAEVYIGGSVVLSLACTNRFKIMIRILSCTRVASWLLPFLLLSLFCNNATVKPMPTSARRQLSTQNGFDSKNKRKDTKFNKKDTLKPKNNDKNESRDRMAFDDEYNYELSDDEGDPNKAGVIASLVLLFCALPASIYCCAKQGYCGDVELLNKIEDLGREETPIDEKSEVEVTEDESNSPIEERNETNAAEDQDSVTATKAALYSLADYFAPSLVGHKVQSAVTDAVGEDIGGLVGDHFGELAEDAVGNALKDQRGSKSNEATAGSETLDIKEETIDTQAAADIPEASQEGELPVPSDIEAVGNSAIALVGTTEELTGGASTENSAPALVFTPIIMKLASISEVAIATKKVFGIGKAQAALSEVVQALGYHHQKSEGTTVEVMVESDDAVEVQVSQ